MTGGRHSALDTAGADGGRPQLQGTARDSDSDGLDDRFEVLIGWQVKTPLGQRDVRSTCTRADSDADGLTDIQEAPGMVKKDANGLVLIDDANEPMRNSTSPAGSIEAAIEDPLTDPRSKDTDVDGLFDTFELTPYKYALMYDGVAAPWSRPTPSTLISTVTASATASSGGWVATPAPTTTKRYRQPWRRTDGLPGASVRRIVER